MEIKLMINFLTVLLMTGVVFASDAGKAKNQGSGRVSTIGSTVITLSKPEPASNQNDVVILVQKSIINGLITVEGAREDDLPARITLNFRRSDKAYAGQFNATPTKIKVNRYEYRFQLKTPAVPGKYVLEAIPSQKTSQQKDVVGVEKYPKIEVMITE